MALSEGALATLAADPTWLALIHMDSGRPSVTDPNFLLSAAAPSAILELKSTVSVLYGADRSTVCRFPARYLWLRARLAAPPLPLSECEDYHEFISRAPAQYIDLVFASESLAQPSSSMGHLFLKLSGQNPSGASVAHAISFYTDTATLNLPKLLVDSLVVGKRGLFALSPYDEQIDEYVGREHRNLWEYRVSLNDEQRTLLQAHLIELKQTRLTYYFQAFNCATLIQQILALGSAELLRPSGVWSTPRSVLRAARKAGLIGTPHAITSARWTTRAVARSVPLRQQREVRHQVDRAVIDGSRFSQQESNRTLEIELARSYNDYLRESGADRDRWRRVDASIDRLEASEQTHAALELSGETDPARSPPETQLYSGLERYRGADYLRIGFLPVSHRLIDDNRYYGSETEFRLFDLSMLKDLHNGRVQLDQLTVYSVASLLSRDLLTGGMSGSFRLGIDRRWTSALEWGHIGYAEGSFGLTQAVGRSIDAFGLVGGGVGYGHSLYAYPRLSLGAVVREVYSLKSIVTASCVRDSANRNVCDGTWQQAAYLGSRWTASASLRQLRSGPARENVIGIEITRQL